MENCFDRSVMWCQFVSSKQFVRPWTKVTSSSGIDILAYQSFKSYHVWCWPYYLWVNTKNLTLVVYRTCVFINETRTPHLTYWTYAHMDVDFANHMQCLRSCVWRVIFQRIRLLKNISPVTSLRLYSFYQLFSNQKNGGMYLFLDVAYICTITGQSGKKIPPFIWYQ